MSPPRCTESTSSRPISGYRLKALWSHLSQGSMSGICVVVCHPFSVYIIEFCHLLAQSQATVYLCRSHPDVSSSLSVAEVKKKLSGHARIHVFSEGNHQKKTDYTALCHRLTYTNQSLSVEANSDIFVCDYQGSFIKFVAHHDASLLDRIQGVTAVRLQCLYAYRKLQHKTRGLLLASHRSYLPSPPPFLRMCVPIDTEMLFGKPCTMVIVGYGACGFMWSKELATAGHIVWVWDPSQDACLRACYDGYRVISIQEITDDVRVLIWTLPHDDGARELMKVLSNQTVFINCSGVSLCQEGEDNNHKMNGFDHAPPDDPLTWDDRSHISHIDQLYCDELIGLYILMSALHQRSAGADVPKEIGVSQIQRYELAMKFLRAYEQDLSDLINPVLSVNSVSYDLMMHRCYAHYDRPSCP